MNDVNKLIAKFGKFLDEQGATEDVIKEQIETLKKYDFNAEEIIKCYLDNRTPLERAQDANRKVLAQGRHKSIETGWECDIVVAIRKDKECPDLFVYHEAIPFWKYKGFEMYEPFGCPATDEFEETVIKILQENLVINGGNWTLYSAESGIQKSNCSIYEALIGNVLSIL